MAIARAAVIGAGVMGSGIAAHLANAGIPVDLLDIVPDGADRRSIIAEQALARLQKEKPAAFMQRRAARLVTPGNLEDDLERLAAADWIVEAVIEDLAIKRDLYARIDAVRKPGSIVSSNTSTIPLAALVEGLPATFAGDFLISHFFNPPRYMRLFELVAGPATRPEATAAIRDFADRCLGKGVVACNDTPGFIGNRIGIYWLQCAVSEALAAGITVEEADAVLGRPVGIPKTGVFGLLDLVGLDLMPHVLASMQQRLAADDPFHAVFAVPERIQQMIAAGYTGRKGKGGFYRLNRAGGGKVKEVIDLASGDYRPLQRPRPAAAAAARHGGLRALVEHDDPAGRYAWHVLARTLAYAARLVPEIADDIVAVDQAMRLGYNWSRGPFELIDQLDSGWFAERLAADGLEVPALLATAAGRPFYRVEQGRLEYLGVDGDYRPLARPDGVLLLADIKRLGAPLARNGSASLWDLGDGVLCVEFHTKMNAMDPDILALLHTAIETVGRGHRALVLYNEGEQFSAGANLGLVMFAANVAAWEQVEAMVRAGQETYLALKRAPFPVVGAPAGLALGGGCEVLLHCDAIQAHAESYIGLVEVGVGVIPAWGGCKELLLRWQRAPRRPGGPMPPVAQAFETISLAKVATSAAEARELKFLGPDDGITMNRDRLLADAKARALALADGYVAPEPATLRLPGPSGKAALAMALHGFRLQGKATAHDMVVGEVLAGVLSGGAADVTEALAEEELLALERAGFMRLVRDPATQARVEHMLETGKPLRN
jgi:3-hydroxyacyl-CoA dehydrogenase